MKYRGKNYRSEKEKVEKLIEKYFNEKFDDYESFKKDIYEKVEQGLQDVEKGNYRLAQNFFQEMEEKYKINE